MRNHALSTFSIDVDTASYRNIRRLITAGRLPPVGVVRIKEMVNYFSYNYPEPYKEPFAISAELGPCPWQPGHQLVRIGLKARDPDKASLPPSNLIFLVDVSGSMNQPNKLPLLKRSMLGADQGTRQQSFGPGERRQNTGGVQSGPGGAFRLLGYENRMLADEDFKDDAKDAGEVGPGQRVTALYELIPAGAATVPAVDELKYQKLQPGTDASGEVLTVKIRYKPLGRDSSVEQRHSLKTGVEKLSRTSDGFRFAAAVAGFGMLLKNSEHKGQASYPLLLDLTRQAKGKDEDGYRAEFIKLLETSELLAR